MRPESKMDVRGFDTSGVQVWGAESGPYVFLRIEAE